MSKSDGHAVTRWLVILSCIPFPDFTSNHLKPSIFALGSFVLTQPSYQRDGDICQVIACFKRGKLFTAPPVVGLLLRSTLKHHFPLLQNLGEDGGKGMERTTFRAGIGNFFQALNENCELSSGGIGISRNQGNWGDCGTGNWGYGAGFCRCADIVTSMS